MYVVWGCVTDCKGVLKVYVFICFSVTSSQTKSLSLWMVVPLGSCDHRYADAEVGALLADIATIDVCDKVSLKMTIIFYTNCRFFTRVLSPCVVLASDWLLTFSNIFSDLLQHFCHIDTVDTKMLASVWLLFIAADQKPAFWCRYGYSSSPTILLRGQLPELRVIPNFDF